MKKQPIKGFSLIELMIVVAIIGVLAVIAVPTYQTFVDRSKLTALYSAVDLGKNMVEEYIQTTGATDCSGMVPPSPFPNPFPTISIPATSNHVGLAIIGAQYCIISIGGAGGDFMDTPYGMPILYSVPTFNAGGTITWALYSNGHPAFPADIPVATPSDLHS